MAERFRPPLLAFVGDGEVPDNMLGQRRQHEGKDDHGGLQWPL